MKTLISILAVLAFASRALAQDVAAGAWAYGPGGKSATMRMTQAGTFTNVGAGATMELSFKVDASSAILERVLFTSTTCTDCDVVVSETTGAGALRLVMDNTTAGAETHNGVVYPTFLNAVEQGPVRITEDPTTGNRMVYVRVTNNDAVARTCIVRLYWRSE